MYACILYVKYICMYIINVIYIFTYVCNIHMYVLYIFCLMLTLYRTYYTCMLGSFLRALPYAGVCSAVMSACWGPPSGWAALKWSARDLQAQPSVMHWDHYHQRPPDLPLFLDTCAPLSGCCPSPPAEHSVRSHSAPACGYSFL